MASKGVQFKFPRYQVIFHISGDQATAVVPRQLQGSKLVDRLYEFLLFMSERDPYKLAEIWECNTWDDLQNRFQEWAGDSAKPSL